MRVRSAARAYLEIDQVGVLGFQLGVDLVRIELRLAESLLQGLQDGFLVSDVLIYEDENERCTVRKAGDRYRDRAVFHAGRRRHRRASDRDSAGKCPRPAGVLDLH